MNRSDSGKKGVAARLEAKQKRKKQSEKANKAKKSKMSTIEEAVSSISIDTSLAENQMYREKVKFYESYT